MILYVRRDGSRKIIIIYISISVSSPLGALRTQRKPSRCCCCFICSMYSWLWVLPLLIMLPFRLSGCGVNVCIYVCIYVYTFGSASMLKSVHVYICLCTIDWSLQCNCTCVICTLQNVHYGFVTCIPTPYAIIAHALGIFTCIIACCWLPAAAANLFEGDIPSKIQEHRMHMARISWRRWPFRIRDIHIHTDTVNVQEVATHTHNYCSCIYGKCHIKQKHCQLHNNLIANYLSICIYILKMQKNDNWPVWLFIAINCLFFLLHFWLHLIHFRPLNALYKYYVVFFSCHFFALRFKSFIGV